MRVCLANPAPSWVARTLGSTVLACAFLAPASLLAAQTPLAPGITAHKPAARRVAEHRRARHETKSAQEVPVAAPAPAPVPPKPNWPVNDPAAPARVTWNSQGLRVEANNSSLSQILSEISTDTGAKVRGTANDQRVFGDFGPASARQVITDLLHGAGYDFLMLGDIGQDTPREVILSARSTAAPSSPAQTAQQSQDVNDDESGDEPQPAPIVNTAPMTMPGNQPPMTPQQRWQQMQQQREQQMLQQRQQMQQQQPNGQQYPPINPPPQ